MDKARLWIGNRRYSSWSLRGWLAVRLAGIDAEEIVLPFTRPGPTEAIRRISPSGLVPCLAHDGALIWESLAIIEYCAELAPGLWPAERVARALARAVAAEMHGGFRELRNAMWMNLGADFAGHGRTEGALTDIARIEAIWSGTRTRFGAGGLFLFGPALTGADVMFAPVVTRFLTWRPKLSAESETYCAAVRAHPLMEEWYAAAAAEPAAWLLAEFEKPDGEGKGIAPAPAPPLAEISGPAGPEPTRYGDWERKGRCVDF